MGGVAEAEMKELVAKKMSSREEDANDVAKQIQKRMPSQQIHPPPLGSKVNPIGSKVNPPPIGAHPLDTAAGDQQ